MTYQTILASAFALVLAAPALAQDITIDGAYVRSSVGAPTAAAFMTITNTGSAPDRLIAAATDAAQKVELHTHLEDANGIMRMREIEGGIDLPAGGTHALARGGDHVMLMGLTKPLLDGDMVHLILTFEQAGDVMLNVPVDPNADKAGAAAHGAMNHGKMDHSGSGQKAPTN